YPESAAHFPDCLTAARAAHDRLDTAAVARVRGDVAGAVSASQPGTSVEHELPSCRCHRDGKLTLAVRRHVMVSTQIVGKLLPVGIREADKSLRCGKAVHTGSMVARRSGYWIRDAGLLML